MATSTDMHVGDVGTVIEVTLYEDDDLIDLSGATVKQLRLQKPDGTVDTKTALFSTDGTDGKVRYVMQADDLDQAGDWRLQVYIETPAGKWSSEAGVFSVLEILEA